MEGVFLNDVYSMIYVRVSQCARVSKGPSSFFHFELASFPASISLCQVAELLMKFGSIPLESIRDLNVPQYRLHSVRV